MNRGTEPKRWPRALVILALLAVTIIAAYAAWEALQPDETEVQEAQTSGVASDLEAHCREVIGEPRVQQVGDSIYVAQGYDLANTILVQTSDGNVIIDTGMNPARATRMREALLAEAPGPVRAIILTHSHIDHVGGTTAWVEAEETPPSIWATETFTEHFFKQYGVFLAAERARGARQFGRSTTSEDLPCIGIGRKLDFDATMKMGVMLPTQTFSGVTSFQVGEYTFRLIEAHGETHDQLFVHIPQLDAIFPGDNWYLTFPNLYTIRGTSPRPVDAWIRSLDEMRKYDAELLIPSHTPPVIGQEQIREELRAYRDAIQWVHDETVRRANDGVPADEIAAGLALPSELGEHRSLLELYGQIDWSARAIYSNALGWFDGEAEDLYPLPPSEHANRTIELMGGVGAVAAAARSAFDEGELRWAIQLYALLNDAGVEEGEWRTGQIAAMRALASTIANSNGRGYLLERAHELEGVEREDPQPELSADMIDNIPIEMLFDTLQTRLIPERAGDVHESVRFILTSEDGSEEVYTVTVRNRVAEIQRGPQRLPGTPDPVATLHTSPQTWREVALAVKTPLAAITSGDFNVTGDRLAFQQFMARFRRGI